jgi:hypothetical protein
LEGTYLLDLLNDLFANSASSAGALWKGFLRALLSYVECRSNSAPLLL